RERADRVAVVRTAERDEARVRGVATVGPELERDLQRLFDRRCAVGSAQEVWIIDGYDPRERLAQLDHRAVAVTEHCRVRAAVELGAQRVVQLGHMMSERVHPQR